MLTNSMPQSIIDAESKQSIKEDSLTYNELKSVYGKDTADKMMKFSDDLMNDEQVTY